MSAGRHEVFTISLCWPADSKFLIATLTEKSLFLDPGHEVKVRDFLFCELTSRAHISVLAAEQSAGQFITEKTFSLLSFHLGLINKCARNR